MWSTLNHALNVLVDTLLWPVQGLGAGWQVLVLALPATLLALLVFRLVSNQEAIRLHKDRIKAYLLELLLYKDDLRVSMAAQGRIFSHSLRYMGHALLPMLVMLVPFILIMVQVESRFALQGFEPGQNFILSARVDPGMQRVGRTEYRLEVPPGLSLETPALRMPATGEVVWRLRARSPGSWTVTLHAGERAIKRRITVGGGATPLAATLHRANDVLTLAYPAEPALAADQPLLDISVDYPHARGEFAGLSSASWLLFLFSIILGFLLRGLFGVTF